jgi:mono/diheme cytochrome c family protein
MTRESDVSAGRGRERLWTRFLSCWGSRRELLATIVAAVSVALGPFDPASASDIDASLVQRGRYVATAGNCASCHTRKGGAALAGGVAFETPFGTVYSMNITPDKQTGIGNWTREQFMQSLRRGVRPNGENLYPVFPYTAFTKVSDADANALFAYLKSVPAVRAEVAQNEMRFPFNQRRLLSFWKMTFLDQGVYEPDNTKSAEWNRGAYLVEGLGHCSACHSPRNFLGAEQKDSRMTGGEYVDTVRGGEVRGGTSRIWSAPNLTSAKSGLGSWTVEDLAAYLGTGRNSFMETFGPMNEVIMNSTRHLSEADTHAMAVYLKSLPANDTDTRPAASAQTLQAGATLYDLHCGTCHLPSGLGAQNEDSGARLAGSPEVQASNPAALINIILYGPEPPQPPLPGRWKPMEGFGDKLTDEEVAALTSYVRNAWGNAGGEVNANQVAKQR